MHNLMGLQQWIGNDRACILVKSLINIYTKPDHPFIQFTLILYFGIRSFDIQAID